VRSDITESKWAYLAGILDGEGTIHLNLRSDRGTNSFRWRVNITNTNLELLNWVSERFGGNIYRAKGNDSNPNHRMSYHLNWDAVECVLEVLNGVLPFLIVKKKLAETLVNFLTLPRDEIELRQVALEVFNLSKN